MKCLNASDGEGGARVRGVGTSKDGGVSSKEEESGDARTVLVPLTGSLYVPGRLIGGENEGKVLVDVGTGFYVEKVCFCFSFFGLWGLGFEVCMFVLMVQTRSEAAVFYKEKVDGIEANLKDLEKIVQGKSGNVRVVEEGMLLMLVMRGENWLADLIYSVEAEDDE